MNFFRLIFLVLVVITFSQKVMSDSHDQNIVEKAKEIHVYEGSFMNLADSVTDGSVPLYGHLYCKPHYFDEKMVHHQIIENIRQNKWHKNNWNYIWKK